MRFGSYDAQQQDRIARAIETLKSNGSTIGHTAVRSVDHEFLYRVDDVYMFGQDVVDLASGAATMEQIIERNAGRVFPDAKP